MLRSFGAASGIYSSHNNNTATACKGEARLLVPPSVQASGMPKLSIIGTVAMEAILQSVRVFFLSRKESDGIPRRAYLPGLVSPPRRRSRTCCTLLDWRQFWKRKRRPAAVCGDGRPIRRGQRR